MHALVLVIVPDGVGDVAGFVERELAKHRRVDEEPLRGRWDGYVIGGRWDGAAGISRGAPFTVENNACPVATLTPHEGLLPQCYAIIVNGEWHDRTELDSAATWLRYCESVFRDNPDASAVAIEAHC
jgi:hypothetical protein